MSTQLEILQSIEQLLENLNNTQAEHLAEYEQVSSRYSVFRLFYQTLVVLLLVFVSLFSYRYYLANQELLHTLEAGQVASVIWKRISDVEKKYHPEVAEAFNQAIMNEMFGYASMQDADGNQVTLEPVKQNYQFNPGTTGKLSPKVIYTLNLKPAQVQIANDIYRYAQQAGADAYETNMLLSLAWAETRFRNIGEGKGTAAKSKAKAGDVGKGVFQWTSPSARRQFGVKDSWNIQQSTVGALKYLRFNRNYWKKKGVQDGTPYMSKLMWAGYNAGTGRAKKGLNRFKVTKHHVSRSMKFYRLITS